MSEMRITSALEAGGMAVAAVATDNWSSTIEAEARDISADDVHAVAIVDLTAEGALLAVEAASGARVPVIAFGPHVAEDTLTDARLAGADAVYPRGRFLRETLRLAESALEP